jgi:hypothetical protein
MKASNITMHNIMLSAPELCKMNEMAHALFPVSKAATPKRQDPQTTFDRNNIFI